MSEHDPDPHRRVVGLNRNMSGSRKFLNQQQVASTYFALCDSYSGHLLNV